MNQNNTDKSHTNPITADFMTREEFNTIMKTGLSQAKSDQSCSYIDVLSNLKENVYK